MRARLDPALPSAPAPAPGRWRAASGAGARAPRRRPRRRPRSRSPRDQDELDRDHVGALVQHLEVGVLGVGARLAPDDRAGRERQRPRPRGRRACRCSPSRAAADTPAGAAARCAYGATLRLAKPWKLRYQTSSRPSTQRQVALDRRAARNAVHRMRAGEQLAEALRRRWRSRSAGRSPTRASSGRRPSPRSRRCA